MKAVKLFAGALGLALAVLLSVGCPASAPTPTPVPPTLVPPTPTPTPLTYERLRNAEFRSAWPANRVARLSDGVYRERQAPDAASELVIRLSEVFAIGDLDGDGVADAAVALATQGGGSGTFYTLEAVVNDNGTSKHAATQLLGDRIVLKSIAITGGEIVVNMTAHGPQDPLCCPTMNVSRGYRLQGTALVRSSGD